MYGKSGALIERRKVQLTSLFISKVVGGWRSTNGHLNHIEDIHELQYILPHPFNDVCCRGAVAASAGRVYLMYSNDWKLG